MTLAEIFRQPEHALVVHYSCESFSERPEGRSPRVTSIAVRYLDSGKTVSFSIHQVAERMKVAYDTIGDHYDELEKTMLAEFYEFASKHQSFRWLHWNMRDVKFGFPALEHRFKVLGGTPVSIPDERQADLSRLFVAIYGVGYIGHPRLENLLKLNNISFLSFLTGQQEAESFDKKKYFKLHESTLRKVDNLANLAERAANGTMRTYSKWRDRYGVSMRELAMLIQTHWLITFFVIIIGVVGSIATILGVSIKSCAPSHLGDGGAADRFD